MLIRVLYLVRTFFGQAQKCQLPCTKFQHKKCTEQLVGDRAAAPLEPCHHSRARKTRVVPDVISQAMVDRRKRSGTSSIGQGRSPKAQQQWVSGLSSPGRQEYSRSTGVRMYVAGHLISLRALTDNNCRGGRCRCRATSLFV